jgi:hypothetical protein
MKPSSTGKVPMTEQMPRFKLNRIQRKNFVRQLQGTVRNMNNGGKQLEHTIDQRKKAAHLLIEFGNEDEIWQTFSGQLQSDDPNDAEFNQYVMDLMAHGFRTGLAEASEEGEE